MSHTLTFDDYQDRALTTAQYPHDLSVVYPSLGLAGETGEVVELVKKKLRKGLREWPIEKLAEELGDVLWYASALASDLGLSLGDLAEANLRKLQRRKEKGQIQSVGKREE